MKRRTFILLGGATLAAGATGTAGLLWRRHRRRRRMTNTAEQFPPLETQTVAQLGRSDHFDVCIIGSGIAGALLASELADAGYSTLVLESGYHPKSPQQRRISPLEVVDSSGTLDYPALTTRLRALGGTTNIWTGNSNRFHPIDLDANPYADAVGPWPVSYTQVEPYYDRAETTLLVRAGIASRFSSWRSNVLPPTVNSRPQVTELQDLMGRAGVELEAYAVSQCAVEDSDPVRSLKCVLPKYARKPRARLLSGATVTRLQVADSGEVVGAEVRDLDGNNRVAEAGIYVVAAGAIESARLLLLSTSQRQPNGLGNSHDVVGRNFLEHVARHLSARVPGRRIIDSRRARCFQYHDDFVRRELGGMYFTIRQSIDTPDRVFFDYDAVLSMNDANRVQLSPRQRDAYGNPAAALSFSLSDRDQGAYRAARGVLAGLCRDIGAVDVKDEPGHEFSHHHMGTCRMGADPRTSVVNADLRVHDSPNTYVIGSSVFSSSGAGHPTVLIVALAHRLGEHLVARLGGARHA